MRGDERREKRTKGSERETEEEKKRKNSITYTTHQHMTL